jgi:Spy/CpxP family protein refolding chaperone
MSRTMIVLAGAGLALGAWFFAVRKETPTAKPKVRAFSTARVQGRVATTQMRMRAAAKRFQRMTPEQRQELRDRAAERTNQVAI